MRSLQPPATRSPDMVTHIIACLIDPPQRSVPLISPVRAFHKRIVPSLEAVATIVPEPLKVTPLISVACALMALCTSDGAATATITGVNDNEREFLREP